MKVKKVILTSIIALVLLGSLAGAGAAAVLASDGAYASDGTFVVGTSYDRLLGNTNTKAEATALSGASNLNTVTSDGCLLGNTNTKAEATALSGASNLNTVTSDGCLLGNTNTNTNTNAAGLSGAAIYGLVNLPLLVTSDGLYVVASDGSELSGASNLNTLYTLIPINLFTFTNNARNLPAATRSVLRNTIFTNTNDAAKLSASTGSVLRNTIFTNTNDAAKLSASTGSVLRNMIFTNTNDASTGAVLRNNADAGAVLRNNVDAGAVLRNNADAGAVLRNNADAGSVLRNNADAGAVLRNTIFTNTNDAAKLSGTVVLRTLPISSDLSEASTLSGAAGQTNFFIVASDRNTNAASELSASAVFALPMFCPAASTAEASELSGAAICTVGTIDQKVKPDELSSEAVLKGSWLKP